MTFTAATNRPAPAPSLLEGLRGTAVLVHAGHVAEQHDLVWALACIRDVGPTKVVFDGQAAAVTFADARTVTLTPRADGGWSLAAGSPVKVWTVELGTLAETLAAAREVIVDHLACAEARAAAATAWGQLPDLPVTITRDREHATTHATFTIDGERITLVAAPGSGGRARWRAFSSKDPVPWALNEGAARNRLERLQRALCGGDPGRAQAYLHYLVEVFNKRVAEHDARDFELMGRNQ